MGSFDFMTFFFIVVSAIVFFQLNNVLGRRSGNERPPEKRNNNQDSNSNTELNDNNVVTLPTKGRSETLEMKYQIIDDFIEKGTPINDELRNILDHDQSFDPKEFQGGAKIAYEMIVMSFADGDRKTLKNLLSREVYESFAAALNERDARSEVIKSSFVGIEKVNITGAEIKNDEALLNLRITSQLISATYDKNGEIIDGDPEAVSEVVDLWTFAKNIKSKNPNWKLVGTEPED